MVLAFTANQLTDTHCIKHVAYIIQFNLNNTLKIKML